jgi:hypothetical protein
VINLYIFRQCLAGLCKVTYFSSHLDKNKKIVWGDDRDDRNDGEDGEMTNDE